MNIKAKKTPISSNCTNYKTLSPLLLLAIFGVSLAVFGSKPLYLVASVANSARRYYKS